MYVGESFLYYDRDQETCFAKTFQATLETNGKPLFLLQDLKGSAQNLFLSDAKQQMFDSPCLEIEKQAYNLIQEAMESLAFPDRIKSFETIFFN